MNGIYMGEGWHQLTHILPRLACLWYPAMSPISFNHLEKWQIIENKCPFQQQERHLPNESAVAQMVGWGSQAGRIWSLLTLTGIVSARALSSSNPAGLGHVASTQMQVTENVAAELNCCFLLPRHWKTQSKWEKLFPSWCFSFKAKYPDFKSPVLSFCTRGYAYPLMLPKQPGSLYDCVLVRKQEEEEAGRSPVFKGTIYSQMYLKTLYLLIERVKMSSCMPRWEKHVALSQLREKHISSTLLTEFTILQKYLCLIHEI